MNIPQNTIYDSINETFVDASTYTDTNGNLVAPPGYSFVQAEVTQTPHGSFMTPNYIQTPLRGMPAMHGAYNWGNAHHNHGRFNRRPARAHRPRVNHKEELVVQTFEALTAVAKLEGIFTNIRQEDDGCYTLRVHLKKRQDILLGAMVVQKIISEIGCTEFSLHYLQRNEGPKFGLTIYMRMNRSDRAIKAGVGMFAAHKIHAKRVRNPEHGYELNPMVPARSNSLLMLKKNKSRSISTLVKTSELVEKRMRNRSFVEKPGKKKSERQQFVISKQSTKTRKYEDEDPDIFDEEDESSGKNSQQLSISKPKYNGRAKSTSIPVLMPNPKEKTLELKFKDGRRKTIRAPGSAKSTKRSS